MTGARFLEANKRFIRHLPEALATALVFALLRWAGWIADTPIYAYVGFVLLAAWVSSIAVTLWPADVDNRRLHLRVAIQVLTTTAVIYSTGWGATLAIGYVFAAADNIKISGGRAAKPVLLWSLVGVAFGQGAIALGVAPTLIAEPQVHGLATLGALGLFMAIWLLGRFTVAKESADDHVRASEERFRSLVAHSSDAITIIGGDAAITYESPSVQKVFGYPPGEVIGKKFIDLVHPDDVPTVKQFVMDTVGTPGVTGLIEIRLRHKDGSWRYVESVGNNLLHDPNIEGYVLNTRDVTERKALEAQLQHRAFHDPLTNLANRALFRDRVEHALARQVRRHDPFAILFLDLDGFKTINDSLGHQAGDEMLRSVAQRLKTCAREADTVARFGGDEFALLLEDMRDDSGAARVANRILKSLRAPFSLSGKEVFVDASIGIVVAEDMDATADDMMRNADIAMYMAKGRGKGCYEVFEQSMHAAVIERLELEGDFQRALERREFVLHYQPIVELQHNRVVGLEALCRWQHPDKGLLFPGAFIPLAEETGLIVALSRWVLREACEQAKRWQDQYPADPPINMSVNISARHLAQPDVVFDVSQALQATGLDPKTLTLEITETALVQDTEQTITRLEQLKALGCRLAIDDFGTGYSSLGYLEKFPIDVLKIDRSFIDGLSKGTKKPEVVKAIVRLGHTLKLETVAEGIEEIDQAETFRALDCHMAQGYFFARPAGSDRIEELFALQGTTDVERIGKSVIEDEAAAQRVIDLAATEAAEAPSEG